jgi:hypothetical protein
MLMNPYESLGPLRLGMSSEEVQGVLGEVPRVFTRLTDTFEDYSITGLQVQYGSDGGVEFIEAREPADVELRGIHLIGSDLESSLAMLAAVGYEPSEIEGEIVYFYNHGFALVGEEGVVKGCSIFRHGYYD